MAGRLAGKRVLVVEDEYFIASDIKRALQNEDAEVIGPVGHLDKGMELASDATFDGAVLDVNLEGLPSYPLARLLSTRRISWIFLTGYDAWSIPPEYRDVPLLGKPFATERMIDAVVDMVGGRP